MKTTVNTGTLELRELYQRYATEALLIAGLLHFAMIGGYQIYTKLTEEVIGKGPKLPPIIVDVFLPPPSTIPQTVVPTPTLHVFEKPSIGTPIPVPNIDANATIEENKNFNPATPVELGDPNGSTLYTYEGTSIDNTEAPPDTFVPVEKPPIAIRQIQPPYPAIPLRAGVEGMVFVRMWVTKEGKVKKAEVAKSTNDLFNQASIDAAMQWTFTPAIMNNGPVSVWVTVPFKFKLNNKN